MPGVSKREVLAWASYDFANSGYTTVILTAVYNAFFVSVVAENAVWATFAWTLTITLSNLLSIAVIPVISALADAQANKRFWLAVMTGICCMSTATLAYTGHGTLASAVFLIVISNTAFNAGVSLNSAFLSELAKPEAFGKVSGWGWSFGYLGGIVSLAACLLIVFEGQKAGLPADVYVPYTAMSTATIFFVMALPMLLYVKERSKPKNISFEKTFKRIRQESVDSFKLLKRYREFLKFCVCGLFYQAGIAVVITRYEIYDCSNDYFDFGRQYHCGHRRLCFRVRSRSVGAQENFGAHHTFVDHHGRDGSVLTWSSEFLDRCQYCRHRDGIEPISGQGSCCRFCSGRRTCPVLLCLERRRLGCQCFGPDHIRNSHLADVRRSKNRNPRDDTFLCYRTFNPSSCAFAV